MQRFIPFLLLTLALNAPAAADVFLLPGGGKVEGKWLNRFEHASPFYVVETAAGSITLAKDKVERQLQRKAELEYERVAPQFADTVQDQWRLSEWCRKKVLIRQRKSHLARILQLQPDHPQARAALGYSQVDGQWVLRDDWRREQGFEYHRGRWRTSSEVKSMRAKEFVASLENDWLAKLRTWRSQLGGPRNAQARGSIASISDPHAVKALVQLLTTETLRGVKTLYIDALANIGDAAALQALILVSVNDPDEEIFHACVDVIDRANDKRAVHAYIDLLKNHNNVRINRAGAALARLQDPDAIAPLIESLVTTHYVAVRTGNPSNQNITTTFTRGQAGVGGCVIPPKIINGLSVGRKKSVVAQKAANREVMGALVTLTGMNYGYDQKAWRQWHQVQERRATQAFTLRQQ